MQVLPPRGWLAPKGYSNGVTASGRLIFLGGQIGWTADQQPVGTGFAEQTAQTLRNIVALLAEAGAEPQHLVRLTWFITDRDAYLAEQKAIGASYREVIGRWFPPMSVVQVVRLMESWAQVEIEATAVLGRG